MIHPVIVAFSIVGLAVLAGLAFGRLDTMRGWRRVWRHKCGHITDFSLDTDDPCEACGEAGQDEWKSGIARDVFPTGYEWKDSPK